MGQAQDICRLRRIAPDVQLVEHTGPGTRRLSYIGLSTCKSSLCPLCAPKWQRTRSEEITRAIDHWGAKRVCFSTLTMRHHPGMSLALQHRLLTQAFGSLWSGRRGEALKLAWGGKPESVRAHDRTWSFEYGWHPHLHVLFFRRSEAQTIAELRNLLDADWPEALGAALRRMQRFCKRTLGRALELSLPETHPDAIRCIRGGRERCKCLACTTDRARRLFGSKLLPKREPLLDGVRRMSQLLKAFSEESIRPDAAHGVQLETIRAEDRAPTYLAKLGLELSFNAAKDVNERIDPRTGKAIFHYPFWGVAHVATEHGNPLRVAARRAWSQLYHATRGTQTITFSDREALGLGEDPYADGAEPPEASAEEFSRMLGSIAGGQWDTMKRAQGHGLLVTLATAHDAGLIERLPYVKPPPGFHGMPTSCRGPPVRPWRPGEGLQWAIFEHHAEQRGAAAARRSLDLHPTEVDSWTWAPVVPRESSAPRTVPEIVAWFERESQLRLRFTADW